MPQEPQYLSTDPNAGEPARGAAASRYLSTDPKAGEPLRVQSRASQITRTAAPTVGGLVGGLVGGIPGAAVGGAAGQGWSEGITEGVTDTAKAAGIEGVSQFAGNKVAQAGGVLAKWLMNRATSRVTAKLSREFPDLSDTLIDEALTVSKGGYDKARGLLVNAKKRANAALQTAEASGTAIPVQMTEDVAESFKTALLEEAIKEIGR